MIEVLFGESEAASMKAAKSKIVSVTADGPTAVFMAGKRALPKEKELFNNKSAVWVEGTSDEVIGLGFMLDIGDISEQVDSEYRKELIYSLYFQNQLEDDEEIQKELKMVGEVYANEIFRLKKFLEDGEKIRIWYSDAPYSRCGFYSLCRLLERYDNEINVVKLPEYVVRENSIIFYKNWGEVAAEEFAAFLPYERKFSKKEVHMYAVLWSKLVEENSPLRAVVNGRVISVPEDFYDFLIFDGLSNKPVKEARLIGNIIGSSQLSVGDWWYAKRIEYYIRQGKIRVVEDSQNKYARLICAEK